MEQLLDQAELGEARCRNNVSLDRAALGRELLGRVENDTVLLVAVECIEHIADHSDSLVGDSLFEHTQISRIGQPDCLVAQRDQCAAEWVLV